MTITQQMDLQRRIDLVRRESFAIVDELLAYTKARCEGASNALLHVQDAANKLGMAEVLVQSVPAVAA
jgi:BMFP domain-containing protein YqiC